MLSIINLIKRSFNNQKLKHKLLISYILLILIPLSIFSGVFYSRITTIIRNNIEYSANQGFDQSFSFLTFKIYQITKSVNVISSNDTFIEILAKDDRKFDLFSQLKDMNTISKYFYGFQDGVDIVKVRIYLPSGRLYSDENTNIFNIDKIRNEKWYKKVNDNFMTYLFMPSHYFKNENNKMNIISVGKTIKSSENFQKALGILRIDIKEENIEKVISKANTTQSSLTYLENFKGEFIASSDISKYKKFSLENKRVIDMLGNNSFNMINTANGEVLVRAVGIPDTDWYMVTLIPKSEINKQIDENRNFIFFLIFILSIIAFILSMYISHYMLRRIYALKMQMKKVQSGDLNVLMKSDSSDEIGELIDNFNFMLERITNLIEEQYQSGKKLKGAELRALQAQINPHFLYNTLEMINRMSHRNKVVEIDSTINALATFYKQSLNRGEDLISIKDEILHVSSYVHIQNMRFMNKLELIIDVEPELLNCKVPKIILQPIVENSIIHGILEKDEAFGVIRIQGKRIDDDVQLVIKDDGVGISEDILSKINNKKIHSSKGSGYGVRNIMERIQLLYGDDYGVKYESVKYIGTTVKIRLPYNPLLDN